MALMKQPLSGKTVAVVLGVAAAVVVVLGAAYFLAPVHSTAARVRPGGSNHEISLARVRADQEARKAAEKSTQGEKPEKKGAATGGGKEGGGKPAAEAPAENAAGH